MWGMPHPSRMMVTFAARASHLACSPAGAFAPAPQAEAASWDELRAALGL